MTALFTVSAYVSVWCILRVCLLVYLSLFEFFEGECVQKDVGVRTCTFDCFYVHLYSHLVSTTMTLKSCTP